MEFIAIILITCVAVYGIINIAGVIWIANDYARHSSVNNANRTYSASSAKPINRSEQDYANEKPTFALLEIDRVDNVLIENKNQMLDQQRVAAENTQRCSEQAINMAQQTVRDLEEARVAATGFEFGGYNPDPNLNPMLQQIIAEANNGDFFDNTPFSNNDPGLDDFADSGWNSGIDYSGFDSFGMF